MKLRVAETNDDYDQCRDLAVSLGENADELVFPTIMTFEGDDDEDFVGFIATTPKPDMVLAGPLVMRDDKPRPFTVIKLIEAYDHAMAGMGVNSYVFWTRSDSRFNQAIKRFSDFTPYASDGENMFYLRNL